LALGVVTVNVNGVRATARRGGLDWIKDQLGSGEVQVICLQEVRATTDQLHEELDKANLSELHVAHDSSARLGHAGVAILSTLPLTKVKTGIGPKEFADTGRYVQASLKTKKGEVTIASVYVHAGDVEKPVQQEKYRFLDALSKKFKTAQSAGDFFLACGDLNVAHKEADLKNWKGNIGRAGFLDEERAYFDHWFEKIGVVDLARKVAGDIDGPYTWWSWRGKAFDTDTGWRIDYHVSTKELAKHVKDVYVTRADSYAKRWSDHAPLTAKFNV
jgi:exodeoxyribonuclease-3